jgi:hypothetical protein
MVEIFKTNVQHQKQAIMLLTALCREFPLFKINFDLDDCDRILRVEGENISYEEIIELIALNGCQCNVLE